MAGAVLCMALGACSNELESGKGYPALDNGDKNLTFKIDKVMQNDVDLKPYFSFFDDVTLILRYIDGKPATLTFTEEGAPFSVVGRQLDNIKWEINSAKTPYEIIDSGTGEVIGHITRDRMVSFDFSLGAPSNKYQYQLLPVVENAAE